MEIISDSIVGTIVPGMGGVGKITEKHLPEPHPAYVKAERIKKARNFQLLLTAANVSDHSDLQDDAAAAVLSVAEVTGSNVVLVAEDKAHENPTIPSVSHEGKTVGTVGCGCIGYPVVLLSFKAFILKQI